MRRRAAREIAREIAWHRLRAVGRLENAARRVAVDPAAGTGVAPKPRIPERRGESEDRTLVIRIPLRAISGNSPGTVSAPAPAQKKQAKLLVAVCSHGFR